MFALRLLLISSAFASAFGRTRGAIADRQDESRLVPNHKEVSRKLMKDDKEEKIVDLTGGTIVRPVPAPAPAVDNKMNDEKNGEASNRQPEDTETVAGQYVAEQVACVPFEGEVLARASLSLTDDVCRTNSCTNGCCRVYHWLICDINDAMPSLACVCNENTRPMSIVPTSTPSELQTTASTTRKPTARPTRKPTARPTRKPTSRPNSVVATDLTDDDDDAGDDDAGDDDAAADEGDDDDNGQDDDDSDGTSPSTSKPTPRPTSRAPQTISTARPTRAPQSTATTASATAPPFVGGKPWDSCVSGSDYHNKDLFEGFTKCFEASDCPSAKECCMHTFCFCGKPDNWDADCVARISK